MNENGGMGVHGSSGFGGALLGWAAVRRLRGNVSYSLSIDLGTTFTAAAISDGSEPTMVGLGNRALQIPSVLFLTDNGFVGR